MRPMIGSGHSFISANILARCDESRTLSSRVYATMRDIQFKSAPAQKFGPPLRSTTARADALEPIEPKRSIASEISSSLKALWTSGRFSVTKTTPSASSTSSVLLVIQCFVECRRDGALNGNWTEKLYAPVAPRVPFSFTSTFTFDDAAVVVVVPNPLFVFAAMFFVTVVIPGPDTVTVSGVSTEA